LEIAYRKWIEDPKDTYLYSISDTLDLNFCDMEIIDKQNLTNKRAVKRKATAYVPEASEDYLQEDDEDMSDSKETIVIGDNLVFDDE
jgi:hypothetical protein